MRSADQRTRRDDQPVSVDPTTFMDVELPGAAERRGDLVARFGQLDLVPLAVRVGAVERVWWRDEGERICVAPPESAPEPVAEVDLDEQQFVDLVEDQVTPIGLMVSDSLDQRRGSIAHLLDWWLVLRSLRDGVPVHVPGGVELPDDLSRGFTLDDDPDDVRGFLLAAGFVHLRGVFADDEMAEVSAAMDDVADSYVPDDGCSWWATVEDGTDRLVRMQRFDERSPVGADLLADDRIRRIAELVDCGHRVGWAADNRLEALVKPLGVVGGISDIPWHKDCSLGRHSYECCSLTLGISVTGAGPTSGQLRVVAGSHRALVWPSLLDVDDLGLPDVALATATGDVTVHLSCTLHMAQPPTERERRVLYTGMKLPAFDEAATTQARRRLTERREAAPRHTSQLAAPTR